ncbi:MAG: hypothetical protein ABUS57_07865 [Pseudomonadota bacterium]
MIRAALISMLALGALASPVAADTTPASALAYFQGCWRGDFGGNSGVTDDRCFAPMLDGQYVRDTHVIHGAPGAYAGETIYYLDAQAHRVAFTYFASDGGVSKGFAEAGANGALVFPPGQWVGADGSTLTMRGSWTPDGPDRYIAVSEIQENGAWVEHLHIVYRRAPEMHEAR